MILENIRWLFLFIIPSITISLATVSRFGNYADLCRFLRSFVVQHCGNQLLIGNRLNIAGMKPWPYAELFKFRISHVFGHGSGDTRGAVVDVQFGVQVQVLDDVHKITAAPLPGYDTAHVHRSCEVHD